MCDICELSKEKQDEWDRLVEKLANAADNLTDFCEKNDIVFIEQYPFQHSLDEMGGHIRYMNTDLNHTENPPWPEYNDMVFHPAKPSNLFATVSRNLQSLPDPERYLVLTTSGMEITVVRYTNEDHNSQRGWMVYKEKGESCHKK